MKASTIRPICGAIAALASSSLAHADPASAPVLTVQTDQSGPMISRDIFGQFAEMTADLQGASAKTAFGEVLTADCADANNSFDQPDAVAPRPVRFGVSNGRLKFHLPPKSVTVVQLEQ